MSRPLFLRNMVKYGQTAGRGGILLPKLTPFSFHISLAYLVHTAASIKKIKKIKIKITDRVSRGGRVVSVELNQVVEGEEDAHQVDEDPQEVQDVVPEEKEDARLEEKDV